MPAPIIASGAVAAGRVAAKGAVAVGRSGASATKKAYPNGQSLGRTSAVGKQRVIRQAKTMVEAAQPTSQQMRRPVARFLRRQIANRGVKKTGKRARKTARAVITGATVGGTYAWFWAIQTLCCLFFWFSFYVLYINTGAGQLLKIFPTEFMLYVAWGIGTTIAVVATLAAPFPFVATRVRIFHIKSVLTWAACLAICIVPFTLFVPWLMVWVLVVISTQK